MVVGQSLILFSLLPLKLCFLEFVFNIFEFFVETSAFRNNFQAQRIFGACKLGKVKQERQFFFYCVYVHWFNLDRFSLFNFFFIFGLQQRTIIAVGVEQETDGGFGICRDKIIDQFDQLFLISSRFTIFLYLCHNEVVVLGITHLQQKLP